MSDPKPFTDEYRREWLEERHEDMVVLVQQMQERAQRAESEVRRLRKIEKRHRIIADMAWRLRQENNELRTLLDARE